VTDDLKSEIRKEVATAMYWLEEYASNVRYNAFIYDTVAMETVGRSSRPQCLRQAAGGFGTNALSSICVARAVGCVGTFIRTGRVLPPTLHMPIGTSIHANPGVPERVRRARLDEPIVLSESAGSIQPTHPGADRRKRNRARKF
jgi:hypothetical protein